MIWRTRCTCSAFELANLPWPVLEPDTDIATHGGGHRSDRQLMASDAEHRPCIIPTKQAVGRSLRVSHVFWVRAYAAEDSEYALHEQWRLDDPAIEEVRKRVKVPDVVAFDLEACTIASADAQDVLDVLEGVLEDTIVRPLKIGPLPVVLERLESIQHGIEPKIHQ
jgi:hypothetical protein